MSFVNISNLHQPLKSYNNFDAEYSISIQSPNNLSSSYTLTLPENNGDGEKTLISDESGLLTWQNTGIGIMNNRIEGDLTIGNNDNDILTIYSKLNIPYGTTGQVLTKQSDGSVELSESNIIYDYYQIKGSVQNINIQHNNPSISSQTKWYWNKDTPATIESSSYVLLSWISNTEFRFNKIGVYRINIKHMVHGVSSAQTFNLGSRISNTSDNIILNFSENFRASSQSSNTTYKLIENSALLEITNTNTGYRWSCGDESSSFSGIIHKQQDTYFTVELMKEFSSSYITNSFVLGESSNSTTISADDVATNGIATVSSSHNGVSTNVGLVHSIFDESSNDVIYGWGNIANGPINIDITFLTPKSINYYVVHAYRTTHAHNSDYQWGIKAWNLQGYNTLTNSWVTIDTRTMTTGGPSGSSYPITNIMSTTQYRWQITQKYYNTGDPGILYFKLHQGPPP